MTTTAASTQEVQELKFEIQGKRNALLNSLTTRKNHPSFGYTKGSLRADLSRLEGMLYALDILTTPHEGHANLMLSAKRAAATLDIDLHALYLRVEGA